MRQTLSSRRGRTIGSCLAAMVASGTIAYIVMTHAARASTKVPTASVVPFSAVIISSQFAPDGHLAIVMEETYNRFADGSFSTSDSHQTVPAYKQLFENVVNLSGHYDIILEPSTKSAITLKRKAADQLSFVQGLWEENCPEDESTETARPGDSFFGFPTVQITKQFDRYWREERWMIRKLNCFSVKEIDIAGPSRDERIVTSLKLEPPSRVLLSPPSGYRERSPIETAKKYAFAHHGEQLFDSRLLAKLTKDYSGPR